MGITIDAKGIIRHNGLPAVRVDCPITASGITVGAGEIGTTELATNAVTTVKITDANVTTAKIADANVTTAKLNAGAVTPAKIATTGVKFLRFDGRNGAGVIALTGAAVGDRVLFILGVTSATGVSLVGTIPTQFEATITVVNEIQQADAADLSANDYWVVLLPATS